MGVVMFSQDANGESQAESRAEIRELVAALEAVLAALDAAGENIAAAHVDMALQMLLGRMT